MEGEAGAQAESRKISLSGTDMGPADVFQGVI